MVQVVKDGGLWSFMKILYSCQDLKKNHSVIKFYLKAIFKCNAHIVKGHYKNTVMEYKVTSSKKEISVIRSCQLGKEKVLFSLLLTKNVLMLYQLLTLSNLTSVTVAKKAHSTKMCFIHSLIIYSLIFYLFLWKQ